MSKTVQRRSLGPTLNEWRLFTTFVSKAVILQSANCGHLGAVGGR
jgi:hypothetical protein